MIHQVKLPNETRDRLTEAVYVQVWLLLYASLHSSLNEQDCAAFLEHRSRFQGRSAQIAAWIWKAPKSRLKFLQDFARRPAQANKWRWARRLSREAFRFLNPNAQGNLTPHYDKVSPKWQQAGAKFLRHFYDVLSDSGLPAYIVGDPVGAAFNRQHLLDGFLDVNEKLFVCSVCDEAGIGTRTSSGFHADIDHFLPQSLYPHLACHPYNLIPICHSCNSYVKSAEDPLRKSGSLRRSLKDVALPYRNLHVGQSTYLSVNVSRAAASFGDLHPTAEHIHPSHLETLAQVFQIPARWGHKDRVDQIGEILFRRLHQFLRADIGLLKKPHDAETLRRKFDEFIGIIDEENQGADPFSYAMKWWMVALVEQANKPAANSTILEELETWMDGQHLSEKLERRGRELRELMTVLAPEAN